LFGKETVAVAAVIVLPNGENGVDRFVVLQT
jgi:hypothetical protein